MGMSRRAYAAHRGVSDTAVRKAIATGRITVEADGSIDPDKADAQWAAHTDPAQQRGAHSQALGVESAAAMRPPPGMRPVPNAAFEAVNETLREEGEAPLPPLNAGLGINPESEGVTYQKVKLAGEVVKVQTQKVRLRKMHKELIDRPKTLALVYDLARRERDAWAHWPPRVAANMAAELGVEPHRMEVVLDQYLRQHLAELAEVKIELR